MEKVKELPVISVIIPVYNAEKYLTTCLDSVIEQSFSKLEIILVDDGSSDLSGTICDDYAKRDHRIQVVHKSNGGPSSARNAGLDVATGDWVTFIDSDDYAEADLCEYLLCLAQKHNADLVQCGAFWEDAINTKHILKPAKDTVFAAGANGFDADAWFHFGNGNWGKLYRRSMISDIRFDPAYSIGEDLYFNFHALARAGCVVLGSEAKYHYVQTPHSLFRAAPSRAKLLSCRNMLHQAQNDFVGHDVLRQRIDDERYRNGLDICSKIVVFRMETERDIRRMIQDEIRGNVRQLLTSKFFSRNEKIKFVLIAYLWPVYCRLLLWSKRGD